MLVKHIGISEERRTIFHIKFFDIAIKIIQTDAGKDAPAKAIPRHFLAGINAVNPHMRTDLGKIVCSQPSVNPGG